MQTVLEALRSAGILTRSDVDRLRTEFTADTGSAPDRAKALVQALVENHGVSERELAEFFVRAELEGSAGLRVLTPKVRVLLVEDNPADVELTRRALLRRQRFEIVGIVHDGDEALSFLRRDAPFEAAQRPDLVILDLDLPRRDGFEVLQALKSDPDLEAMPVIVLSGTTREGAAHRAFATRAVSFIQKPSSLSSYRHMAGQLEVYWSQISALP